MSVDDLIIELQEWQLAGKGSLPVVLPVVTSDGTDNIVVRHVELQRSYFKHFRDGSYEDRGPCLVLAPGYLPPLTRTKQ
jgi:hypothetical protein